jgi:hypothetical protein
MSKTEILILIGWDVTEDGQETHFDRLSQPYYYIFGDSKITQFRVKIKKDISAAVGSYKGSDINNLIIIYCGHGTSSTDEHPLIIPYNIKIDLYKLANIENKETKTIKYKYIFDCCNTGEQKLNFPIINDNEGKSLSLTDSFMQSEINKIHIRKGILNWALSKGTIFGLSLVRSVTEYKIGNFELTISLTNDLMRTWYVDNNKLINKRIKRIIESEVPYTQKDKTKFEELQQIDKIKVNLTIHQSMDLPDIDLDLFGDDAISVV